MQKNHVGWMQGFIPREAFLLIQTHIKIINFEKNEIANTIFSSAGPYGWSNLVLLNIILEMMALGSII